MKRNPGLYTVLFLLLMLSGKLLYAATLPVFMDMPFKTTPQQVQCHDMAGQHCATEHGQQDHHDQSGDHCAKSCLESCASHALPSLALTVVGFQKASVEFHILTSRLSRRLEPLYRPPQA